MEDLWDRCKEKIEGKGELEGRSLWGFSHLITQSLRYTLGARTSLAQSQGISSNQHESLRGFVPGVSWQPFVCKA